MIMHDSPQTNLQSLCHKEQCVQMSVKNQKLSIASCCIVSTFPLSQLNPTPPYQIVPKASIIIQAKEALLTSKTITTFHHLPSVSNPRTAIVGTGKVMVEG